MTPREVDLQRRAIASKGARFGAARLLARAARGVRTSVWLTLAGYVLGVL